MLTERQPTSNANPVLVLHKSIPNDPLISFSKSWVSAICLNIWPERKSSWRQADLSKEDGGKSSETSGDERAAEGAGSTCEGGNWRACWGWAGDTIRSCQLQWPQISNFLRSKTYAPEPLGGAVPDGTGTGAVPEGTPYGGGTGAPPPMGELPGAPGAGTPLGAGAPGTGTPGTVPG